ncbi:SPRY-domain-containing protein [Coprinopsis marcescibilis]|uniref:SPRY-domain-containing protein n=1 Tax=Coprinopsis marcescibilis TaxID=230819 RepID=A0A5C3LDE1_COPMA|nr:SPRY-domain-containing protein [Coprinopsis marcescibilis]
MASRSSRTSSIPIPASTSNVRNIENVISIPSSSSSYSRNRVTSSSSLVGSSPSLARSVPRSASLSASRSSLRQHFEPRVIRAAQPAQDFPCPPASPTATRRASIAGYPAQHNIRQRATSNNIVIQPQPTVSAQAFPRPSYLDNSSFRDGFITEAPPPLVPLRKPDPSIPGTSRQYGPVSTLVPSSDSDDESIATPPPRPTPSAAVASSSSQQSPRFKLPSRWNTEDRHNYLSISPDGRDLTYNGSNAPHGDKDGAAARANCPVPPACGIYYYEVQLRGKEQKSHVSIGFSGPNVKTTRLPGWEQNSWGYHGDDGFSFAAEKNGSVYSQTYGAGDYVGCGIDFSTRRVFYTKNGQFLGPVFNDVGKGIDLYPAVGMQQHQESIRANFGQEPFIFDIDNHVQQQKTAVWNKIMSTPLHVTPAIAQATGIPSAPKTPLSEEESKVMLNKLVMSYLIHHGYAKTVRAFQHQVEVNLKTRAFDAGDKDVEMEGTSPIKESFALENLEHDIERRTEIVNAVATGDIDTAIRESQNHYPTVLEAEAGLMLFKLRCRKFVELVLATAEMKKGMKKDDRLPKVPPQSPPPFPSGTIFSSRSVVEGDWLEDDMDMDVDDDAAGSFTASFNGKPLLATVPELTPPLRHAASPSTAEYEAAISAAIVYGQAISDDYKSDPRPEVQALFKQTFGILAWDKPLEAGNDVAAFVSKEARLALATELNQTILKSQGRPVKPALETLYRHASACVTQLGVIGEGSAAFADLRREFIDA